MEKTMISVEYLVVRDGVSLVTIIKIEGKYGVFFGKDTYGESLVDIRPLVKLILTGHAYAPHWYSGMVMCKRYKLWTTSQDAFAEALHTLRNMNLSKKHRTSYLSCYTTLRDDVNNRTKLVKTELSIFDVTEAVDSGNSAIMLSGSPYNPKKVTNLEITEAAITCSKCEKFDDCTLRGEDVLTCDVVENIIMATRKERRSKVYGEAYVLRAPSLHICTPDEKKVNDHIADTMNGMWPKEYSVVIDVATNTEVE